MLYQLSYSRVMAWWPEITPKNRIRNRGRHLTHFWGGAYQGHYGYTFVSARHQPPCGAAAST